MLLSGKVLPLCASLATRASIECIEGCRYFLYSRPTRTPAADRTYYFINNNIEVAFHAIIVRCNNIGMRSGEKWCLKRPLAPFLSKATEAREGIDLLSIPTISTTAESTYHWNSRIHDRIELCNKKMFGTYSSRMFYDIATYKIVLMFRGYGMTFLSQFPLHTNASCMFETLLLSFTENSLLRPKSLSGQLFLDITNCCSRADLRL